MTGIQGYAPVLLKPNLPVAANTIGNATSVVALTSSSWVAGTTAEFRFKLRDYNQNIIPNSGALGTDYHTSVGITYLWGQPQCSSGTAVTPNITSPANGVFSASSLNAVPVGTDEYAVR